MSPLAVSCTGLAKSYGSGLNQVQALRGVELEALPGELMMLVGPSGCGKTTLISVIAGILNPDQGSCRVLGVDVSRLSDKQRTEFRAKNIGFVFQAFNLIPTLTVAENVAVPLVILGESLAAGSKVAEHMLARVGLSEKLDRYPYELSGGQQQRVAIARALVHQPKLIVCDEPTSALDHKNGVKIMEIFREVGLQDGRSLIVVTHDSRIFEFADQIAEMDDGEIVKVTRRSL